MLQRRSASSVAALVSLSFTCGCYTTHTLPTQATNPITQQVHDDALVIELDGQPVRVDPNSRIRFLRADGSYSDWFRVSELAVSEEGVLRREGDGLLWADIQAAELKNFSGGKTLGALAITTAAVVVVVAVLAAGDGGSGGGGRGAVKPPKGVGRPGSGRPGVGRPGPNLNGCCVTAINVNPGPPVQVQAPVDERALGKPGMATPDAGLAQQTFPEEVKRRAAASLVASFDVTSDLSDTRGAAAGFDRTSASVALSGRFYNVFELGGGLRQYLLPESEAGRALAVGVPSTIGFLRAGLHLPLGARHLVAAPVSVDMGALSDLFFFKVNAGMRFQLNESFALGAFPLNPTLLQTNEASAWTFPSSLELSVRF